MIFQVNFIFAWIYAIMAGCVCSSIMKSTFKYLSVLLSIYLSIPCIIETVHSLTVKKYCRIIYSSKNFLQQFQANHLCSSYEMLLESL